MKTRTATLDWIALTSVLATSVLTFALSVWATPPMSTPAELAPGANESLAMVVPAKGVQIYECRARQDGAGYDWVFVAPEAVLLDADGRRIGLHGAGPFWQASDGSRIVGTVKQRAGAPVEGAIPWLLLETKAVGPKGSFSDVTSIQRVNTHGGVAPKAGCTQSAAGSLTRVDYTADYYFFTAR
jgi:hypothetical protein